MIKNGMKRLWAQGKPVLNGWLSIANSFSAEIMSQQGYDSVTIDMQHGAVGYDGAFPMLQAMRSSEVTPMVRVPWLDPADIMKALDAGAYGVICPMINSREEAERLVSYVRYPPTGVRSFGPIRALFSAGPGYANEADDEIVCLAMIETAQAVANLDDILATPGLDGIYIGPADLTLGLRGKTYPPGFDRREPEMVDAIQDILKRARKAGKRAGIHNGTADYAARAVGWGFDLVTVSNDVRLMAGAAEASVKKFRELTETSVAPAKPADRGGY
ncbi:MAG: 2,4-dihydroxyhept-2-ene-1,7-dioic acid aldolase [Rhizobiaceae bacterium]|nr:2,4-dihydroxyhept-2-ene-1,7-dioic acid aldolase [Rhizobiaceae bacterium]